MPDIEPFRAWRYNLGHIGELSDVVAPPYDVIDAELRDALYKRHPCNVIRLILNREEPGDDDARNRYTRAARFLRQWREEQVLFEEGEPALYVYHQEFAVEGQVYTRRHLLARMRLEPFGKDAVFPHEETRPGPKADRLALMRATGMNLSAVFGLYPDPEQAVAASLDQAIAGKTPLEATDHLGVVHRMWPVYAQHVAARVKGLLGPKPVYIADGHHRYETALTYRDELAAAGKLTGHADPANFVLVGLSGMNDPGMLILPTHRLVSGLPQLDASRLAELLGDDFTLETVGRGEDACREAWERIEASGEQSILGFGTVADDVWQLARLRDVDLMARLVPGHSPAWRRLGVSILHEGALKHRLLPGLSVTQPQLRYVHLLDEVLAAVAARECQLACLVPPATMEHIRTVAGTGERMPAKSTYFYPKLLSGLVLNPLR